MATAEEPTKVLEPLATEVEVVAPKPEMPSPTASSPAQESDESEENKSYVRGYNDAVNDMPAEVAAPVEVQDKELEAATTEPVPEAASIEAEESEESEENVSYVRGYNDALKDVEEEFGELASESEDSEDGDDFEDEDVVVVELIEPSRRPRHLSELRDHITTFEADMMYRVGWNQALISLERGNVSYKQPKHNSTMADRFFLRGANDSICHHRGGDVYYPAFNLDPGHLIKKSELHLLSSSDCRAVCPCHICKEEEQTDDSHEDARSSDSKRTQIEGHGPGPEQCKYKSIKLREIPRRLNALRKELFILGKVAAATADEDISTGRTALYWYPRDGQDDKPISEQATDIAESEQATEITESEQATEAGESSVSSPLVVGEYAHQWEEMRKHQAYENIKNRGMNAYYDHIERLVPEGEAIPHPLVEWQEGKRNGREHIKAYEARRQRRAGRDEEDRLRREAEEKVEWEQAKRKMRAARVPVYDYHDYSAPLESTADDNAVSESTVKLESSAPLETELTAGDEAYRNHLRNLVRQDKEQSLAGRTADGRWKGKAREQTETDGSSVTHSDSRENPALSKAHQFFDHRTRYNSLGFGTSEPSDAGHNDNSYRRRVLGDRDPRVHGLSGIPRRHFRHHLGNPSGRTSLGSGHLHTSSTRNSRQTTPTYLSIYHGPKLDTPGFFSESDVTAGPNGTASWSSFGPLSRWNPENSLGPPDWNPEVGHGSWQPVLSSPLIRNPIDGSLRPTVFRWVFDAPPSDTL